MGGIGGVVVEGRYWWRGGGELWWGGRVIIGVLVGRCLWSGGKGEVLWLGGFGGEGIAHEVVWRYCSGVGGALVNW